MVTTRQAAVCPISLALQRRQPVNGVYTFTPSTDSADAGDFKMRLTASDGNRVTVRTIDTTLVFYAAFSNLLARYDVGDSNSVTGTNTSWPDTSGKSAAAATIDHHSGNGAVETGLIRVTF